MSASVLIPNPLYDVVFRYLMDDNKVARILLSAILGETVEELAFQSTEQSLKLGAEQITVTRMDFHARIRQTDGQEKVVLIELQKAKLYHQIGRFRRYLGQQYQRNPQSEAREKSSSIPIFPIYLLGEPYSDNGVPVVRVRRDSFDVSTGEKIPERHPFIEALTHDAIVIQTRYLNGRRRTELERLLSIFDQSAATDTKGHFLALNEEDMPPAYRPVIRRLQLAMANAELEADMDLEDEVIREFQKKDAELQAAILLAEREREQKELARKQADEERKQKEEERKQKEEERRQKEATRIQFVRYLASQAMPVNAICEMTGLDEDTVKRILNG